MYGNMENKTAAPKNIMAKIYTIAGFLIALSIGLVCVSNIIHDRMKFRDEAVRNVETTWGKAQTIGVGELEYKEKDKKDINTYTYDSTATTTKADAKVELKKKGIYEVPVYSVKINQKGEFKINPAPKGTKAEFKFKVSDPRGFISKPVVKFNNIIANDCSSYKCNVILDGEIKIPYEIEYSIRGTKSLTFDAVGTSETYLSTNYWVPEYTGDFSPVEHKQVKDGYYTYWSVPEAASAVEDKYRTLNYTTNFINTVDVYRMTERCVKYGFLFIALTFLAFFVYEIINKNNKHIHPFQYSLIGVSMLVFYLLLLSISEFIDFSYAYLTAAIMTIGLISFYTYFVLTNKEDKKFPLAIGGILGVIYLYLYITINLEELSLLAGSFGLFFAIIAVMYATRNVEWYKENQQ